MRRASAAQQGRLSRWLALVLLGALASACLGCSIGGQKKTAETALSAMSAEQRRTAFEATARAMDENPGYVDELYAVLREHDPAMRRVVMNVSEDPKGLSRALKIAAHALEEKPEARHAARVALGELVREMVKDKPLLEKAFRAAGFFDDEEPK